MADEVLGTTYLLDMRPHGYQRAVVGKQQHESSVVAPLIVYDLVSRINVGVAQAALMDPEQYLACCCNSTRMLSVNTLTGESNNSQAHRRSG